ncbi:MAG: hypothetical protein DI573_00720 [Microbacterium sp.]|uniref:hypothetical protein n=1 Tax=unclassified Microbacterium TaxID=2609290 RepID=UPI000DAFFCAD|nr:hypothetical protein [Microbacterium sp.]PZU41599.1 MAG: hypothetical protein DI573_00720 [Microbacterium sp.]
MTRVGERAFDHRVIIVCGGERWSGPLSADRPLPEDAPFRGFVTTSDAGIPRFAWIAGRTLSHDDGAVVTEGLLYEVSERQRDDPPGIPANGRRFRQVAEMFVTGSETAAERLRAAC